MHNYKKIGQVKYVKVYAIKSWIIKYLSGIIKKEGTFMIVGQR